MKSVCLLFGLTMICFAAGCGESIEPKISALRQKLVLSSDPGEPVSVGAIRKALKAEDAPGAMNVVIRGRIYIGDALPWENGKAAFVVTDATGHEGETDHDPHTCPFCKTHIEDYFMFVSFMDDDGKVAEVDSRELFELKEKQRVVVKGKATLNAADEVVITGSGVFVEK